MPDRPLQPSGGSVVRPLRRVSPGVWKSRDGSWTFLRHQGDPHPQRWYAYQGDDEYPANDGGGQVTLRAVVEFVEDGAHGV